MTAISTLPEVTAFLSRPHGHYIHGRAVESRGDRIAVVNPSNEQEIADVADATRDDVNAAVASSRAAFEGAWGRTTPAERANVLLRLADLFEKHREELAQIETLQSGKTIQISRAFEVNQAIGFLKHYAGAATRIHGETITPSLPSFNGERYSAFTRREPVGVVVGIVPWNFSILIAVWKFASALATGCTVIIKPSQFTPLTLLRIAELATEAGAPAGAFNVISGGGNPGRWLIDHEGTAKVSFTGSVPTGIAVGRSAMDAKLTRATLELGGKNAVGFLTDVDADKIVAGTSRIGLRSPGTSMCRRRALLRASLASRRGARKLKGALTGLQIGDPMDERTQFGPLSNRAHFDKIVGFFDLARSEGGTIAFGGQPLERTGYFVTPTAVLVNDRHAKMLSEETFGPIATSWPMTTRQSSRTCSTTHRTGWRRACGPTTWARR